MPAGDFPNLEHYRDVLKGYNFDKFDKLKPQKIQAVDDMLSYDIPNLLKSFRNPYEWTDDQLSSFAEVNEKNGDFELAFCCFMNED